MKLIDEEVILAALEAFSDLRNGNTRFLSGIETAKEIATRLPEAVVRCKDCRYFTKTTDTDWDGECNWWRGQQTMDCSFCGFGERRSDETD